MFLLRLSEFILFCLLLISSNLEQLLVTVLSLRTDFSNQVTVRVVCKLVFFSCNRGAIIQ